MADDLQRVGLVFKADGAVDFKKTLDQVNTAVQENRNAFNLAKAAWDDSTSSVDKLRDRQEYLAKQTETYSDKVNLLEQELKQMESAENRNEKAIRKKQNQLTQAKTSLLNYQKGLEDVTRQLTSGAAESEEKLKSLDDTLGNLTAAAKQNETAFEALKSSYDKNTTSLKKYEDQQKYLANQVDNYVGQLRTLQSQLITMESAEDRNERAIREKRSEINQVETALNGYRLSAVCSGKAQHPPDLAVADGIFQKILRNPFGPQRVPGHQDDGGDFTGFRADVRGWRTHRVSSF